MKWNQSDIHILIFITWNIISNSISINLNMFRRGIFIYINISDFLIFLINNSSCTIIHNIQQSIVSPILPTLTLEPRWCYWLRVQSLSSRTMGWGGGDGMENDSSSEFSNMSTDSLKLVKEVGEE